MMNHLFVTLNCWLLILLPIWSAAQSPGFEDTLQLSLKQADSIFLKNNLELLAQRYQIESDAALVQQARLWNNPSLEAEVSLNSVKQPRFLSGAAGQQMTYQLEQVIRLAGKRNKEIQLAELNTNYSEALFRELMRTLRKELHNKFYTLAFKTRTLKVLKEQAGILQRLVATYQQAAQNGSVRASDYIRLRALYIRTQKDLLSLMSEVSSAQEQLQILLHSSRVIKAELPPLSSLSTGQLSLFSLLDAALGHRPDLALKQIEYKNAEVQYQLQKALAIPDLTVGVNYDRADGIVPHYIGLNIGMDLPFWNRNQGAIKASHWTIKKSELEQNSQEHRIKIEVAMAYQRLMAYQESMDSKDLPDFSQSFAALMNKVAENFSKGNLSLLEFVDFFDSYSANVIDLNDFFEEYFKAYENLEYAIGKSL